VHFRHFILYLQDSKNIHMLLLGIDLGSSSVKVSVIDGETGNSLASAFHPKNEMQIIAEKAGWAEQEPEVWWKNLKEAIADCNSQLGMKNSGIGAIGISYQMHGLVAVDNNKRVIRPSIIWCDGRAVEYGEKAFNGLGKEFCLTHLLNSPGNFTATKLAWVKDNEPDIYSKIWKIMLPGDYLALRMTGEALTTYSGLSEGILWDFLRNDISDELMGFFGFDRSLIAKAVPSFSEQGYLKQDIAAELGLPAGIPISYRAGDQPNNALSLNVVEPGEVAATAGTSGVIYGVTDQKKHEPQSRVNTFLHINHSESLPRAGVLLCISGTGILNSWLRKNTGNLLSYNEMNELAGKISPGSDGLMILPFGNGAERMLGNRNSGAMISGLNFNTHSNAHLFRAAQEGIVFSFRYGLDIMKNTGIVPSVIRAGASNMFLSPLFREALASITNTEIDLYNTDGSLGAARGAGIGCGYYKSVGEAFSGLKTVGVTLPDINLQGSYTEAYNRWKKQLENL
jgi:xylulokinase